jgi:hypothetical protein
MNNTDQANNFDTCDLARMLQIYPSPLLTNIDLQERWHCSRSTVDRTRKARGLRSDGPTDGHPVFDLLAILEVENMPDPLAAWALGTHDDRTILSAPLLSIEDLKELDRTVGGHHAETFRRRARTGKSPAFRVGRRWLIRPTMEELARLKELRKNHRLTQ